MTKRELNGIKKSIRQNNKANKKSNTKVDLAIFEERVKSRS